MNYFTDKPFFFQFFTQLFLVKQNFSNKISQTVCEQLLMSKFGLGLEIKSCRKYETKNQNQDDFNRTDKAKKAIHV